MSGYSIRSALRHLIAGLRSPRDATREAVETGLGEFRRLSLVVLAAGSVAVTSSQTSALFDRHLAEIDQSELFPLILNWIVAVLLAGSAHYLIGSALAFAMLLALRPQIFAFSSVRSAWAIATWITVIPMLMSLLGKSFLSAEFESADWPELLTLLSNGIWTIYSALCLAEISGVSLLQAFVAASFASLGLYVLSGYAAHVDSFLSL